MREAHIVEEIMLLWRGPGEAVSKEGERGPGLAGFTAAVERTEPCKACVQDSGEEGS